MVKASGGPTARQEQSGFGTSASWVMPSPAQCHAGAQGSPRSRLTCLGVWLMILK